MSILKEKVLLILLIVGALTAGIFVGTALADDTCSCTAPDDPCGDPDDNCCHCDEEYSTCLRCGSTQFCTTAILDGQTVAKCEDNCP